MDIKGLIEAYQNNDTNWLVSKLNDAEYYQLPIAGAAGLLGENNDTVFIEICNWMFENGLDVNAVENNGNTGLLVACIYNKYDYVKIYIDNKANINLTGQYGLNPIIAALNHEADFEIIKLLVENGASLNTMIKTEDGLYSTLEQAIYNSNMETIEYLLENGASIEKQFKAIEEIDWSEVDCEIEEKKKLIKEFKDSSSVIEEDETVFDSQLAIDFSKSNKKEDTTNETNNKNLDEKIYEFLKKENKPTLISEIQKRLKVKERRQVTQILQLLNSQGLIFRSIKEGKAYYSINETEGEGLNSIQENINLVKMASDTAYAGFLTNLNKQKNIPKISNAKTNFNFTYKENKKYENKRYSILIPDQFEIIEEEDRDFVATLPNPEFKDLPYNFGGALINIYPGTVSDIPETVLKNKIPEVKQIFVEKSYYITIGNDIFAFDAGTGYIETKHGELNYSFMNAENAYNYYFQLPLKNKYQLMRIELINIDESKEYKDNIAIELMNNITLKENSNDLLPLDDETYLNRKLTPKELKTWLETAQDLYNNLKVYLNFSIECASTQIDINEKKGISNIISIKELLKDRLKRIENTVNKNIKQIENFLNKNKNTQEEQYEIYKLLYNIISNFENPSITISATSEVSRKNEYISSLKEKLFTPELINKIEESNYEDDLKVIKKELNKIVSSTYRNFYNTINELEDTLEDMIDNRYDIKRYEEKIANERADKLAELIKESYIVLLSNTYNEMKESLNDYNNYKFKEMVLEVLNLLNDDHYKLQTKLEETINHIFQKSNIYYSNYYKYKDTDKIRKIIKDWKDILNSDPEYKEIIKKQEEEKQKIKEEKENKKREFIENIGALGLKELENIDNETEEIANHKKECINIIKKKYQERLDAETKTLEKTFIQTKNDYETIINKRRNENKNLTDEIANLSFIHFIKKSELEGKINENKSVIELANQKIESAKKDYNSGVRTIQENIMLIENQELKDIENNIVFPASVNTITEYVKKLVDNPIKELDERNKAVADEIKLALLEFGEKVTVESIMCKVYYSKQKTSAILQHLVAKGEVIMTEEHRIAYYELNDLNDNSVEQIRDYDIDTSFSKDRKEVYEIVIKIDGKDKNDIIDVIQEKLPNLSKFRIFQVLHSLEQDGVTLRYYQDKFKIIKGGL